MNDRLAYGGFVYDQNLDNVKRQLGKHHIQMIALAGIIGTGLFLGLGQILALTGPLGSLLVFIHVATVVYATMVSVGEMTSYAPISGSFLLYAARWLDPAIGFALGWNYFYYIGTAIPLEITAFSAMIKFWDTNPDHTAIYITVITVALLLVNLFGVRWFGNSEIFFASLKIMLVLALIIGGLVISLGGGPDHRMIGFKARCSKLFICGMYNVNVIVLLRVALEPGAKGRFLGLLVSITPAVFAIGGIELISITVAETKQPRTNIIKAMRTVVFRLAFFFIASVIVVGMLVPSNDPALFKPGESAGQSPFVIAFQRAGVKAFPSIVNAVLLTSAFSAANTFIFSASRVLYGLAVQNQAPRVFTTCTQGGLPWVAVIASWLFSFLAFMNVATSSATVFNWVTINATYLRYYYGLKRQGITPRGIYRSPLQPYAALWAIFWVTFYILVSGISVFWEWNAAKFVAAYFNLPLFFLFFIGYKLWYKTKMTPLEELDFVSNIPTLEETGDEALLLEKPSFAKKLGELI
ncbi:general amino acid permease [Boletus edulis BED1]|uniref:General amino acid permease n=1 Tax=Boletus edulis BED1 TaxID=1328754 RepID=A0AAD4GME9_BOLED|nr:general amino acid permease [Boletus edulis BED1]